MESNQSNNTPNEEALFELLTLSYEVNEYRTQKFRNKEGQLHRIYGPAIIYKDGEEWYKNGKLHRENGPAISWNNNVITLYYINGVKVDPF